ncbi:hypothetical protein BJ138DRAFT_1120359 [Hygrophoropsis aurantiaca]|uniref:Uncharacterized protein n=1 Tax=Hygrophoropsis aurantiaca TaxID=72124 RepID=A0ACB7ZSY6_9AGAM|nr:hypothetical protein BJ138DRAFT_1120359 [Hygrophoropsis aurantiaca]
MMLESFGLSGIESPCAEFSQRALLCTLLLSIVFLSFCSLGLQARWPMWTSTTELVETDQCLATQNLAADGKIPGPVSFHSRFLSLVKAAQDLVIQADGATTNTPELHYVHAPALSMPFEILVRIFLMTVDCATRGQTARACSQVCRQWRNAANDSALLWAAVLVYSMTDNKHWVEEILRRSKSAPLHLEAYLGAEYDIANNILVSMQHMDRIRSFSISIPEITTARGLQIISSFPPDAPMLDSLVVRAENLSHLDITPLLSLRAPRLGSFTLQNCYFDWKHFHFRNLTRIVIVGTSHPFNSTLRSFLDALSASPMLQELSLAPFFVLVPVAVAPISLGHLKQLVIEGTLPCCTALLASLALPSIEAFELHLDGSESDFSSLNLTDLFSCVQSRTPSSPSMANAPALGPITALFSVCQSNGFHLPWNKI